MIAKLMPLLCSLIIATAALHNVQPAEVQPSPEQEAVSYTDYDFMHLDIIAPADGLQIAEGDKAKVGVAYRGLYQPENLVFGLYVSDELEDINKSVDRVIAEYDMRAKPMPGEEGATLLTAECSFEDLPAGEYAIWAYAAKGSKDIEEMVYVNAVVEVLKRPASDTEGWYIMQGKRYYGESGYVATGWRNIDNAWYYFDASGAMVTGWNRDAVDWFYMGSNGQMITGWRNRDGNKHFFTEDGAMARGWLEQNGNRFYFTFEGEMLTGWQDIEDDLGSNRYYFESTGHMSVGWKQLEGGEYYFQKNGKMATGLKNIDGKTYVFGSDGRLLN